MRAAALTISINALDCADDSKKRSLMFMRTVVERQVAALQFASEDLKRHLDFVTAAVLNDPAALIYASDEFKHSRKRMLDLLQHIKMRAHHTKAEKAYGKATLGELLQRSDTSGAFQEDVRMLGLLASDGPEVLHDYAVGLSNPDFMFDAATVNKEALRYIRYETMTQDQQESLWTRVIKHFHMGAEQVLSYVSEPQIQRVSFWIYLVQRFGIGVLQHAQIQQVSFWLSIVQHFGIDALEHASADILSDVRSMTELAREDIQALRYASDELRADPKVMARLAKTLGKGALEYASYTLRADPGTMAHLADKLGEGALHYATGRAENVRERQLATIMEEMADPAVEGKAQSAVKPRKKPPPAKKKKKVSLGTLFKPAKWKRLRDHSKANRPSRYDKGQPKPGEEGLFELWDRFFDGPDYRDAETLREGEKVLFAKWMQYKFGNMKPKEKKVLEKQMPPVPPNKRSKAELGWLNLKRYYGRWP